MSGIDRIMCEEKPEIVVHDGIGIGIFDSVLRSNEDGRKLSR